MYSRKSVESRMEASGTPILTGYFCEDFPFRITQSCLLFRKDKACIASIFIRGYYLQYANILSLSNKESVVVSAVIPVHASGKQGEIKSVSPNKMHLFSESYTQPELVECLMQVKEFLVGVMHVAGT